jgi:hypothetical protein
MLFPAAKLMDTAVGPGLDFHSVIIPPAPAPIPMTPHAYMGALMLWNTPQFPAFSKGIVLINSVPACAVGAMGYGLHAPMFVPGPTFTNLSSYWRHHLVNVPKALGLMLLTTFASMAIGALAFAIPKNNKFGAASADFMKDVTGIDSRKSGWEAVKGSFASYTNWFTWVHLLIPPAPYPAGQASTAVGSPTVTVNGGPLAFSGPLIGAACSDLPFVPNANIIGFSNVLVGVSMSDLIRGIAVHSAQAGISYGVNKAVDKATSTAGKTSCGGS